MTTADQVWKAAFRKLMPQFVEFFFPHKYDEIDWSKGVEYLDKELNTLLLKSKVKNRIADVLVKLHLKNGDTIWILLHIEVQGYIDNAFALRVHQMSYRIEDLFGQNPVMLSIFTDDNPNFHPKEYVVETWGSERKTVFNTYKVMENAPPYLHASPNNPASLIMEVVYEAIHAHKLNDMGKIDLFLSISRKLFRNGYSKQDILLIANFINVYINFENPDNYTIFEQKFHDMGKYETTEDILRILDPVFIEKQNEKTLKKIDNLKKKIADSEKRIEIKSNELEAKTKAVEVKSKEVEVKIELSIKLMLAQGMTAYEIATTWDLPLDKIQYIQEKL